jgi:beta-N-acetylhexosaminidase
LVRRRDAFQYNLGRGSETTRKLTDECLAAVISGQRKRSLKTESDGDPTAPGSGERYLVLPFVAVDHEGGSVHRFASDATRLPAAADFGELAAEGGEREAAETVREAAYRSGLELRALGVTLNLAPVAEAADDRNVAFLGDRSYGADGDFVAAAARPSLRAWIAPA